MAGHRPCWRSLPSVKSVALTLTTFCVRWPDEQQFNARIGGRKRLSELAWHGRERSHMDVGKLNGEMAAKQEVTKHGRNSQGRRTNGEVQDAAIVPAADHMVNDVMMRVVFHTSGNAQTWQSRRRGGRSTSGTGKSIIAVPLTRAREDAHRVHRVQCLCATSVGSSCVQIMFCRTSSARPTRC